MTSNSALNLLRTAQQAHAAGQEFLHTTSVHLDEQVQQAARDNLVALQQIIDELGQER